MSNTPWPPAREFKALPDPWPSPEELKRFWGISDTSRDASLPEFSMKWRLATGQWLGRNVFFRDRVVYRQDPDPEKFGRLPDAVQLIYEALGWLLQYQRSLDEPATRAEEERGVLELSRRAGEIWQEHPEKWVIWTRILALLREEGGLWCGPSVNWIVSHNEPYIGSVRRQRVPVVTIPEGECRRKELILFFTRADSPPTQRVDIIVDWGGEQNRVRLPGKNRQGLARNAQNGSTYLL